MATAAQVAALQLQLDKLQAASDARYTLLTAANCFLMLLGFALLEAGSLRAKNLSAVMLKQFVVTCVVTVVWYLWGHGAAFGVSKTDPNNFIGSAYAALHDVYHTDPAVYSNWFFQMTFCAVSCSIVSGAIGERMKFPVYLVFLFLMSGWIYPVVAYAQWSTRGWNSPFNNGNTTLARLGDAPYTGVVDAAGCGPVHMVGGICAFMGAWLCGPRKGRFDPKTRAAIPMPGHNSAFVTMGVMILWFSWFSFNTGGAITDQANQYQIIGHSSVTTAIASAAGGFTVLMYKNIASGFKIWPLTDSLNGVLAGLVSITAGCTVVEPWAALVIGIVSAFFYLLMSYIVLEVFRVDDPVDATAVHFGGGVLGLFSTGLFAQGEYVRIMYGKSVSDDYAGAFMGGNGKMLGYQLVAVVFITVWAGFFGFLFFFVVDKAFGLRYSEADEEAGLDAKMFGGDGYDYLTPLQQVNVLTSTLTALRSTLMDGSVATAAGGGEGGSSSLGGDSAARDGSGGRAPDDGDDDKEDLCFNDNVVEVDAAGGAGEGNEPTVAA